MVIYRVFLIIHQSIALFVIFPKYTQLVLREIVVVELWVFSMCVSLWVGERRNPFSLSKSYEISILALLIIIIIIIIIIKVDIYFFD